MLTPTRELAAQVGESVALYGQHLTLRSTIVYGGVKINPQMMALRKGADVLIATPGRLMDLYQQNAVSFKDLEILVLDEADRMLDMGFINDIRKILALLPAKRQSLLFSATFSPEIRTLAKGFLQDPLEIDISPRNTTAESVDQWVHPVDKGRKAELLSHLITSRDWRQALVFTRTKHGANKLVQQLMQDGIRATAIHGNKSQGARTKALDDFKTGRAAILVATDIAARGLDIIELPQVVNFDLPNVPEDYVHRIGRTGRAGSKGRAISLVSADEFRQLWDIEKLIGRKLTRDDIKGFEPEHAVPESKSLKGAPPLPKKPKQKDSDRRPRAAPKPREDRKAPAQERKVPAAEGRVAKPVEVQVRTSRPRADQAPIAPVTRDNSSTYVGGTGGGYMPKPVAVDRTYAAREERSNTPRGDRPYTPRSGANAPRGDRPYTPRDSANAPRGDRPYTPRDGANAPRGDRPYTPRDGANAPRGDRAAPARNGACSNYKGSKPAGASNNGRYEKKPAYTGVYQPVVAGANDYRAEQRLQSFGNRADIPADKLKDMEQRSPRSSGPRPAGGDKPRHSGPKKPYAPRDRY